MKNSIYLLLSLCLLFCLPTTSYTQEDLRIKDNNGNTLMEVREDGMLIRQLTTAERTAINLTASENGSLVYDTDTKSFWAWKDSAWVELVDSDVAGALPVNPAPGTMAYYDGNNWVAVAPGNYGAPLSFCDGVPSWGGCLPKVTTNTNVFNNGLRIRLAGQVLNDGGVAITERGFVWSLSPNPTLADFSWTEHLQGILGEGLEEYNNTIVFQTFATTYYVRAYATNSVGTAYGNEITFTTIPETPLDVVLPNNDIIKVYPIDVDPNFLNWAGINEQDIAGLTNYTTANDASMDYDGENNTTTIVNALGNVNNGFYAAKLCADFVSGDGKDDWYLPAAGELQAIVTQLGPSGNNGFSKSSYWSSTEVSSANAWVYNLYSWHDFQSRTKKFNNGGCRCVRRD